MPEPTAYDTLAAILSRLNALAPSYHLGRLQALRMEVKGLERRPKVLPFPSAPNNDEWAFHLGGRQELQFNVGFDIYDDGTPALRHGVAFSFEPGHDLPDPEGTLLPQVAHFNDYVRAHADRLDDLRVWTWRGSTRGRSRPLGPLGVDEIKHGVFVFIGWLGPRAPTEAALHAILRDLDRLMPLYETVLRASVSTPAGVVPAPPPIDGTSMRKGKTRTVVHQPERLIDVALRHMEILKALHEEMVRRHGQDSVRHEHRAVRGGRVDLRVVEDGGHVVYYEVKTAAAAKDCIREALGQLLEYAHWPGAEPVHELVVASDCRLDDDAAAWLRALSNRYGLPLRYFEVELVSGA